MGGITHDMLKRRAEHNEGILHTLEELVLQEEGIDKIDNVLGTLCPNLRILYMPNNLIPKIENFHRLKEIRYLNLAINNIVKVEGLQHCEFLEKLDLTLNFVEEKELMSVSSLRKNIHLRDLYLTGNPCQDFSGYRKFVVASLPFLQRLDACDIKPSERIAAKQDISQIIEELSSDKDNTLLSKEESTHGSFSSSVENIGEQIHRNEKGQVIREYSLATRLAEHAELSNLREQEKTNKDQKPHKPSQRRKGFDPLPDVEPIYQKNEGSWNFKLHESECRKKILLDVPVGRFLDSSLIEVDVHPLLVRVLIKGKLLQLRLPEEVKSDASTAERSTTTGHLVVSMPKVAILSHALRPSSKLLPKSKSHTGTYVKAQPSRIEGISLHKSNLLLLKPGSEHASDQTLTRSSITEKAKAVDTFSEKTCYTQGDHSSTIHGDGDVPPLE
ncbi:hypothetical protein O6H91_01G093700 [Diphasiastrum complanatum]|uniref:Uncharacterized protein n=2 Tax=Diphasiastrum complanatum TaxID=34168 RepID=A0ACC2ETI9_DIPCM|nr:hypothetical protein O6H91_01G093700 [Diphasiastrum complanatum]KAJ7569782.1 hypothetical protein O6H91_01G093700 [Diphasiastrum complanatum]